MKRFTALPGPVRDGIIIGFTTGLIGVVFGVLSRASGLDIAKTCVMSLLVFTGASQFTLVSLHAGGAVGIAALGPTILLSARNALYGPVVAKWFPKSTLSPIRRGVAAQLVIDESTGIGAAQSTTTEARLGFWSAGLGVYVLWNVGTLIGAVFGDIVGDTSRLGLDAAFPASFVALLAPHLASRPGRVAALCAGAIALAVTPVVPTGIPIMCAFAGALVAAMLPDEQSDDAGLSQRGER